MYVEAMSSQSSLIVSLNARSLETFFVWAGIEGGLVSMGDPNGSTCGNGLELKPSFVLASGPGLGLDCTPA
jgi:hypothetical protein